MVNFQKSGQNVEEDNSELEQDSHKKKDLIGEDGFNYNKFMYDERKDDNTGNPYTNRGRNENVKKILKAYGFSEENDPAHPCFEQFVRK